MFVVQCHLNSGMCMLYLTIARHITTSIGLDRWRRALAPDDGNHDNENAGRNYDAVQSNPPYVITP